MNQINVNVVPAPYVKPTVDITSIHIRVMNVVLFKSVNVNVTLFSNNDFVDSKSFLLEGADYTSWGNDDTYIVNYVLNKLGLTESGPVVHEPEPVVPVVTEPVVTDPEPVVTETV